VCFTPTIAESLRPVLLLTSIYVAALLLADIIAVKLVQFFIFVIPLGTFLYAITFLITDIAGEVYGKHVARQVVLSGLVAKLLHIFACVVVWCTTSVNPDVAVHLEEVLQLSPCITIASVIAYLASQLFDVEVFEKIRKATGGKHLWLRNNASTIMSQTIDTVLFCILAFYLLPVLVAGKPIIGIEKLPNLILAQLTVKYILALGDTGFCYLGVKLLRRK